MVCSLCIAGIAGVAGSVVAGSSKGKGSNSKEKYQMRQKILWWTGVLTVAVALILVLWAVYTRCKSCGLM